MKIGPLEVVWASKKTTSAAIRQEVGRLIERDENIRWAIARCARSVTKDFLAELAEDGPADQVGYTSGGVFVAGPITCEDMGHDPRIHSPSGRAELAREGKYPPDVPISHLEDSRLTDAEQNLKNLEAFEAQTRKDNPS